MIVGLSGYAGAGKSTAATELVAMGYQRRKFAAPLKNMMRALLLAQGADAAERERMIEGDLKEVPTVYLNGQTPRYAMQTLGTDWGRALISESLWADAAVRDVTGHAVFDDVRFDNEAEAIRSRGGVIIEIRRPGVGPVNNHVSERPPAPDHVVVNDGTAAELALAVWLLTV
jgi:hypothetical protein